MTLPALAVLAGGLATRLGKFAKNTPKILMPINGEPFLAHQLRLFRRQGLRKVVLLIGHLGEQVKEFAGDGSMFGIDLEYSDEGSERLGTGGAVKRALPLLGDRFMLTYGDSYLDVDIAPIWEAFIASESPVLMTVLHNLNRWDSSNAVFDGEKVTDYNKDAVNAEWIDFGFSCFETSLVRNWTADEAFDLAEIPKALSRQKQLAGFEVKQRFYEIGRPKSLRETELFLSANSKKRRKDKTRKYEVSALKKTILRSGPIVFLLPLSSQLNTDALLLLWCFNTIELLMATGRKVVLVRPINGVNHHEILPKSFKSFVLANKIDVLDVELDNQPVTWPRLLARKFMEWFDFNPPSCIVGADCHGLLLGPGQLSFSKVALSQTQLILLPLGCQLLELERRCAFVSQPHEIERQAREETAAEYATHIIVTSPTERSYASSQWPNVSILACESRCSQWFVSAVSSIAPSSNLQVNPKSTILYLGEVGEAGGIEALRGILEVFSRKNRRVHVEMIGWPGSSATGTGYQTIVEVLEGLGHDISISIANDPVEAFALAVNIGGFVLDLGRLPTMRSLRQTCEALEIAYFCPINEAWSKNSETSIGAMRSRYTNYSIAAASVMAFMDGEEVEVEQPNSPETERKDPVLIKNGSKPTSVKDLMVVTISYGSVSDSAQSASFPNDKFLSFARAIISQNGIDLQVEGRKKGFSYEGTPSLFDLCSLLTQYGSPRNFLFLKDQTQANMNELLVHWPNLSSAISQHGFVAGIQQRLDGTLLDPLPANLVAHFCNPTGPFQHLLVSPDGLSDIKKVPASQSMSCEIINIWACAHILGRRPLEVPVLFSIEAAKDKQQRKNLKTIQRAMSLAREVASSGHVNQEYLDLALGNWGLKYISSDDTNLGWYSKARDIVSRANCATGRNYQDMVLYAELFEILGSHVSARGILNRLKHRNGALSPEAEKIFWRLGRGTIPLVETPKVKSTKLLSEIDMFVKDQATRVLSKSNSLLEKVPCHNIEEIAKAVETKLIEYSGLHDWANFDILYGLARNDGLFEVMQDLDPTSMTLGEISTNMIRSRWGSVQ